MPLLICRNLTLGYGGSVIAQGISLTVREGDYLCIVGENGAGKSTLVKALLGLKAPMSGTIEFREGLSHKEIGYLPQQTSVQRDFPASVEEVVLSGCLSRCGLRPYYRLGERETARRSMAELDILKLRRRCYRELSGGQQQRVLLARALCAARRMLLLDEPVAGLDPRAAAEMYAVIERLNREERITVIMISHDIRASLRYASHILHIGRRPLFYGPAANYPESDVGRLFAREDGGEYV